MKKSRRFYHQKVVDYFQHPESKIGFDYILWGAKHFGYYPRWKNNISEREAQLLLHDLVALNLKIKESDRILDAGCGQGVVSTYLAKKYGAFIFGITLVPFEVEKAQERAINVGVQNQTKYQIMDYSDTVFADNYFDAIYTTESLSHSPDIRKTLREFFRILKPAGRIALFEYTIAPDNKFNPWEKKIRDLVIEGSAMFGLKSFRHNQFTKVIRQIGFKDVYEQNISEHIGPSFYRLHRLSIIPYWIIRILRWQKYFINITAGYEYYQMAKKDLFRYVIFTGKKPKH